MKNLERSICSTCSYIFDCVLTTNKSTISSCSEYMHQMDQDSEPLSIVTFEMFCGFDYRDEKEESVLY